MAGNKNATRVALFTTSGKKIADIHNTNTTTGNFTIDLARWLNTAQMMIIQITTGTEKHTIHVLAISTTNLILSSSPRPIVSLSLSLQKAAAALDSITITHFGYNPATIALPQLDTMIDTIKLFYEFRKEGDPVGMIRIPGGLFKMGRDVVGNMSYPAHSVFVSPYYMDSTELTQKEYKELTGKEPWLKHEKAVECGVGPDYPAWHVNWYDAVHFCNQRSKKHGLDTVYTWTDVDGELGNNGFILNVNDDFEKNGYRLPTEAEWEYACRAGTRTTYYWGATADSAIVTKYEWARFNSKPISRSNEVAKLLPNPLNLYDMLSNQVEWCNDKYAAFTADFQENPRNALGLMQKDRRVYRSGQHGSYEVSLSSTRFSANLDVTTDTQARLGFRVVLPVKEK